MAFGSSSAIFQYVAKNVLGVFVQSNVAPTGMSSTGFLGDTMKFALYGNSGTPDKTVATAVLCSYNGSASQWVTANEVTGTGYTAGGNTVPATKAWATDATAGPCFTSSGAMTWTSATITAYGGLLYDASVTAAGNFAANQGVCFNSFGGSAQSVSGGTFTVQWATAGSTANTIFNVSV